MTQFTTSTKHETFTSELATRSNEQAFAEFTSFIAQKNHGLTYPMNSGEMAFWNGIYELHGGNLQTWDDVDATSSGSIEAQQSKAIQTAQVVQDAVVAERNRLARELHDAVTQTLFAASLIAEVLPDLWETDEAEAHKSAEQLRQLTRGALAEMRTLLFELRPAALKQARLSDLLKQLSEAVGGRKGLPIHLHLDGDCEIPCDVKVEMYRIVQESLNNVVKYACAGEVKIDAKLEAGHVHITIQDNGIGFDPTCVKPTSLGLRIMCERAESIHAQLKIASEPGLGTTVSLDWYS